MNSQYKKYVRAPKHIVIVGFGSIGQAVLPLIFRHIDVTFSKIIVVSKNADKLSIAQEFGAILQVETITRDNYQRILGEQLEQGDFLLNLSVDVSSYDLIQLCQNKGVLYLDTCTEPWKGGYQDESLPLGLRTNYAFRENVIKLKKKKTPTTVITHGANPGLVSHFLKQALSNLVDDNGLVLASPKSSDDWAYIAHLLNIKSIHIAERDSQVCAVTKSSNEFVNTWSVDGFMSEGLQPAELGWGTHERYWPLGGNEHAFGSKCAIYLDKQGASIKVRTWTPNLGTAHGLLITHAEAISISNYLTLKNREQVCYRPTVHYAYVPCPDAMLSLQELIVNQWRQQKKKRILLDEITDGTDALGVLLLGNQKGAYWYGSQLSIQEARKNVPYNSATSLQVAIGVLAGMIWAIEHPDRGLVEPEEVDYKYIMNIAKPYLGHVEGYYSDWSPLQDKITEKKGKFDESDPWQFLNIQIHE